MKNSHKQAKKLFLFLMKIKSNLNLHSLLTNVLCKDFQWKIHFSLSLYPIGCKYFFFVLCQVKIVTNRLKLKVPLTPKCFLNRNKTLFGVDYFGEKISATGLFLDFLWIFKVRKIAATLVHGRELRRMGLVVVCDVGRGTIVWHSKRKFSAKAVLFERS